MNSSKLSYLILKKYSIGHECQDEEEKNYENEAMA